MTKKEESMVSSYEYFKKRGTNDIYDAYKAPSVYKVRAWEAIKRECEALKGFGLCVLGHNCMKYSAAFQYASEETGEIRLRYYTANNTYDFAI